PRRQVVLTIDLHTHILPGSWPDLASRYGYGGWVALEHHAPCRARMVVDGQVFREIGDNCWSAPRRLEECDRAGVQVQVLSTVPVMFSYWARPADALDLAQLLNDHLAETVALHPRRFVALGTVPLQSPDLAIRELTRCVRELGMPGIQIGTHVGDWNLDHPALFPVFQAAEELGAAVFVHPWDMLAPERMTNYWLRWLVGMPTETALAICSVIFGGVLERLPRLRLGFAHGGGSFPGGLGRIEHGFRARPDLVAVNNPHPPGRYLERVYVDSLTHDADALRLLLRLHGPSRVALGSDYPFPLGEACPGALIAGMADLDDFVRARLLHGTALEFLDRSLADFS
ncbi:MAG TPA: amidohydrolase family protein, partial [Gemmatimonadales bacterium]|nr:amidohydrolase family protein [Gemmatimonadales bacterium]